MKFEHKGVFTADEQNRTKLQFWTRVFQWKCSHWKSANWTNLTCTKLTQLHDALLVTRVSVTKLIGCRAAVRTLQFCSVQFACCEQGFIQSSAGTVRETVYRRWPGLPGRRTHHLEQPAGQRDICPVSVNLPSTFKTFLFQASFPDIWSAVNYSPPPVDPEVILPRDAMHPRY